MAAEAQRLIGISLTKIAQSRANRGGVSLHKNLLVATVLQKARYVFMEEAYNMIHYPIPCPSPPVQASTSASEENLVGLTAEEAGIEPLRISEDVQEASTSESSLPDFLQPCVRCNETQETQDKENQPPPYHGSSELTYLDLDKNSSVLRERSGGCLTTNVSGTGQKLDPSLFSVGGLKRRRAVAEWETEEAVQSILPKRSKSDDEDDSVFLDDASALSDVVSKEMSSDRTTPDVVPAPSGSAMEIDRITSLVSIFSFGMSDGNKLNRSVSTPDLCSAQAKDADDALQQRPYLAMTV